MSASWLSSCPVRAHPSLCRARCWRGWPRTESLPPAGGVDIMLSRAPHLSSTISCAAGSPRFWPFDQAHAPHCLGGSGGIEAGGSRNCLRRFIARVRCLDGSPPTFGMQLGQLYWRVYTAILSRAPDAPSSSFLDP